MNFETMPVLLNIGVGKDYSINEYYAIVAKVVGFNGNFVHNCEKPVGMLKKLISIKKQQVWGWKPKTCLKQGIDKTYNYYLKEFID